MENVLYLSILDKKMGPNKSKRDFGSGEYRIYYIYIYILYLRTSSIDRLRSCSQQL